MPVVGKNPVNNTPTPLARSAHHGGLLFLALTHWLQITPPAPQAGSASEMADKVTRRIAEKVIDVLAPLRDAGRG